MDQIYKYIVSISIAKALLHIKTKVVVKLCFTKEIFLLFLVTHEKLFVVLA